MDKKHVAEWRERSGDKKTRSQVNRPEPSCLVTAHLAHLGVQLQDPHISDTDVSSHKYKGQSLGDWYRMQTPGSAPQYLLLAGRDIIIIITTIATDKLGSLCWHQTMATAIGLQDSKHSLESSAPANETRWFAGLTKEITAELSWAFLYNNNLGNCSTMNGTVPLSAELRENVRYLFFC